MFEITVTRNYNENTFKDDMKRLYNQLGVEGKPTVFLFTAAQVQIKMFFADLLKFFTDLQPAFARILTSSQVKIIVYIIFLH